MKIEELVKDDFGITGNGRWLRSVVHSSLVVDSDKNLFYFNARGLSGGVEDYLVNVRGMPKHTAKEMASTPYANLPNDIVQGLQTKFSKLVDIFHKSGRSDRSYWYDRKLTDSTIDRYRLGNFDGWNFIPIYNDGLFVNFQCRQDKPKKRISFWYKDEDFSPVLFNKDILQFVKKVYITEGMVDCLLLNQLGYPAVCPTNGALSWNNGWISYFSKIIDVIYIADNDSAGIRSAIKVVESLGQSRVRVLRFKDRAEKYGSMDFF